MAKRNKFFGMNKYQKKSHRRREDRLRGNEPVSHDYETEFETNGTKRFVLVCEACDTA